MIPRGSFTILAGDAGVGKSYLSYTLALSVASGQPFLGHPTEQLKVLYLDEENGRWDQEEYLRRAWYGIGQPALEEIIPHLRVEHMSLARDWKAQMAPIIEEYQPALVVIDTVTPALGLSDENDNAQASLALRELHRMQALAANDCAFLLIKHAKFLADGESRRTIRGAKVWIGATDATMFYIKGDKESKGRGRPRGDGLGTRRLLPEKSRAYGLSTELKVVSNWTDSDRKGLILRGFPEEASDDDE